MRMVVLRRRRVHASSLHCFILHYQILILLLKNLSHLLVAVRHNSSFLLGLVALEAHEQFLDPVHFHKVRLLILLSVDHYLSFQTAAILVDHACLVKTLHLLGCF